VGASSPPRRLGRATATTFTIQRIALALFVERGFPAVTAEQIADAAEVSVRSFYRHFPDGKEGVLLLETHRGVELFLAALRARPPQESAFDAMRAAAVESIRLVDDPDDSAFGFSEARLLYGQVAAANPALVARMIGERVLLLEPLVELIALRMAVDPSTDVRPRLLVHAANTAITVGWLSVLADPGLDRSALLLDAFEAMDQGLSQPRPERAAAARRPAHRTPAHRSEKESR